MNIGQTNARQRERKRARTFYQKEKKKDNPRIQFNRDYHKISGQGGDEIVIRSIP